MNAIGTQWLTIEEAAEACDRSTDWIRRQVRAGHIPAFKEIHGDDGKSFRYLIKRDDLQIWMLRDFAPRGRAGGERGRLRYVVTVPTCCAEDLERVLVECLMHQPGVVVKRGAKVVLQVEE